MLNYLASPYARKRRGWATFALSSRWMDAINRLPSTDGINPTHVCLFWRSFWDNSWYCRCTTSLKFHSETQKYWKPMNTTLIPHQLIPPFRWGVLSVLKKNEAPRLRALRSREQVVNLKELSSKNEVTLGISDILRLHEFKNSISN